MEKSKQKPCDGSSIDRLSALPDAILCHILSFLPTKFSVATTILSKRWMYLWAYVPDLDFRVRDHPTELEFDRKFYEKIYKVMLLYRVENMNKLKIYSGTTRYTTLEIETCVAEAIRRNVKLLDLFVVILDDFPCCIFTCKTLVALRLSGVSYIPVTCDVCLPALKKLTLHSIMYESEDDLTHLLAGCPVLEELDIDRLDANVQNFKVSSSTIKSLVLQSWFRDSDKVYRVKIDAPALEYLDVTDVISKDVSVGALPSLIEAHISIDKDDPMFEDEDEDDVSENDEQVEGDGDVDLNNDAPMEEDANVNLDDDEQIEGDGDVDLENDAPIEEDGNVNLDNDEQVEADGEDEEDANVNSDNDEQVEEDANVNVDNDAPVAEDANGNVDNDEPDEGDVIYSRCVLEFVGRLCNVKCLKLSTGWMQISDSEFSTWAVKFQNLIKLDLYGESDWRFITNFLENADNLEFLVIRTDNDYMKYWMEPKQVPTCLSSHLGTVKIDNFGCTDQEFHMIRYILRNAKVLKKMEIRSTSYGVDLEEKFEALKIISLFERGSVDCELAFH